MSDDGTTAGKSVRESRLIGVLTAAGFLAYMLLWWNAYYAPTNGGEIAVMNEYLHGRLPYRDWYSHQPPGIFFVLFAIARVFGPYALPNYLLGLVVRTLAVFVLQRLLAAHRSAVVAGVVTLVAAIASCCDDSEFVGHYHHWSVAFLVFSAAAMHRCVVGEEPPPRRSFALAALAGVMMASTFLIKQTTGTVGVGIVGLAAVGTLVLRREPVGRILRLIAGLALGFAVLVGLAMAWLAQAGLFGAYVHLVYGVAPGAKGGILTSLLRPLLGTIDNSRFLWSLGMAVLFAACGAVVVWMARRSAAKPSVELVAGACTIGLILFAILVGRWFAAKGELSKALMLTLVYVGFVGALLVGLYRTMTLVQHRDDGAAHGTFVGWLGFGCAYSLSVSWPAFEPMMFPALAVVLTEVHGLLTTSRHRRYIEVAAASGLLFIVFVASFRRHLYPYRWAYWAEPPLTESHYHSVHSELAGLSMSRQTATFIDQAVEIIKQSSSPDETVLVFPHLWLLAGLADRRTVGFAPIHWFDTCPDVIASGDARAILRTPPAVMVVMDLPDALIAEQESFFRGGHPSGQREMLAAVHAVVERDHYVEAATFPAPGARIPIRIWVRPKAGAAP
jgi:hypothetical protein